MTKDHNASHLPARLLASLLLAASLSAQTAPHEAPDPLGRGNPQSAIVHFLEACHAHDYRKAAHYLDTRQLPPAQRGADGPELAEQLEDLLDDTPFDIATLSRDPEGDQSDGLSSAYEHLDTFRIDGKTLDLQLIRVELAPDLHDWLVAAPSLGLIPAAHKLVAESSFEKALPQQLVTTELFDTPIWRWIALLVFGIALWFVGRAIEWGLARLRPGSVALQFQGPARLCFAAAGLRLAVELAPPASLARLYVERGIALAFSLGIAWLIAVVIDVVAERWHSRLDPRVQAVSYSVLPLGRQVLKLSIYLFAGLLLLSAWGYNTSTILAGLGVGGLAIALAAQKTIENLFGGVSVIGDRPVLVGDVCRFGDHIGTVMHIGLRSTRIRTLDRTIVSVPNGQFAAMTLENISGRDKMWFHPSLNLRRDATAAQINAVLKSVQDILASEPKIQPVQIPVRLVEFSESSFHIEVSAYIATTDFNEFLAIRQELLLKILAAIETAGTALAVPLQETFERQ